MACVYREMTGLRAASGMKATGHTRDNTGKFTNYQQGQEMGSLSPVAVIQGHSQS